MRALFTGRVTLYYVFQTGTAMSWHDAIEDQTGVTRQTGAGQDMLGQVLPCP